MPDVGIRLLIEAENRASAELSRIESDAQRATRSVTRGTSEAAEATVKFGRGLREATQTANVMSQELLGRLNPALAGSISQLSLAAGVARNFSPAMGALTVAVVAASAALGDYAKRIAEAQDAQTALNSASRNFDIGAARGVLKQAGDDLEHFRTLADAAHKGFEEFKKALSFKEADYSSIGEGIVAAIRKGFAKLPEDALDVIQRAQKKIEPLARIESPLIKAQAEVSAGQAEIARLGAVIPGVVAGANEARILSLYEEMETRLREVADAQTSVINLNRDLALEKLGPYATPTEKANLAAQAAGAGQEAATRYAAQQVALEQARREARLSIIETLAGPQAKAETPYAAEVGAGGPLGAGAQEDVEAAYAARRAELGLEEPGAAQLYRGLAGARARADIQAQAAAEAGYGEEVGAGGPQGKEAYETARAIAATEAERLGIAKQRLEVLAQIPGLTQTEQENVQLLLSAERERIGLQQLDAQIRAAETGDQKRILEDQKALLQVTEERHRFLIEFAQLERTDPSAGLGAGFRDVADEVSASGARMREGLVNAFHDINRSFGDIVIAGITGQTAKIGDIGKQLGASLLRGFVDQFTTRITGTLFNALGGLLGPAGGYGRAGGGGYYGAAALGTAGGAAASFVAPAGLAAGTLVPTATGVGRITATGTVQPVSSTAGSPAYGQGGDVAMSGGGGFVPVGGLGALSDGSGGFASGFFGPSVSLYDAAIAYQAAGTQGIAALQSGQAVISGGQYIATTELAAFGGYEAAPASLGLGPASSGYGALAASSLTFVAGAAGVAFSAYSAYQSGAAGDKYAALTGAVSGAAYGAIAGSVFGPYGTLIGAVAGAAIGGGAGAVGKEEHGPTKAEREQRELKNVANATAGFQAAVDSAQDLDGLYDVLIRFSHSNYGGGQAGVSPETAGFAFVFDWEGARWLIATRPVRTAAGLKIANKATFRAFGISGDETTFNAAIQAGINAIQLNQAATQTVQQKILTLREQELRGLLAYGEGFNAPGVEGTAVTRLTVLPSSRYLEATGQQILYSRDELLLAGFSDDMIEAWIRRVAKVDRDRGLGAINAEHLIF